MGSFPCIAVFLGLTAIGTAGAAPKVLVIHSFGSAAPPFTTHSIAFETELTEQIGEPVDLDEVSLDHGRYATPDTEEALVDYLQKRHAHWQPDLVVPIGSPAGIFVAWEGVTLGMTLKTRSELDYLRRTGSGRADSKRQEHEDWLVLLVFNHLFAGLDAYVAAHLADFPGDLRLEALPEGVGAGVSVPLRSR